MADLKTLFTMAKLIANTIIRPERREPNRQETQPNASTPPVDVEPTLIANNDVANFPSSEYYVPRIFRPYLQISVPKYIQKTLKRHRTNLADIMISDIPDEYSLRKALANVLETRLRECLQTNDVTLPWTSVAETLRLLEHAKPRTRLWLTRAISEKHDLKIESARALLAVPNLGINSLIDYARQIEGDASLREPFKANKPKLSKVPEDQMRRHDDLSYYCAGVTDLLILLSQVPEETRRLMIIYHIRESGINITIQELSDHIGVSRERIRRTVEKSTLRIQKALAASKSHALRQRLAVLRERLGSTISRTDAQQLFRALFSVPEAATLPIDAMDLAFWLAGYGEVDDLWIYFESREAVRRSIEPSITELTAPPTAFESIVTLLTNERAIPRPVVHQLIHECAVEIIDGTVYPRFSSMRLRVEALCVNANRILSAEELIAVIPAGLAKRQLIEASLREALIVVSEPPENGSREL